MVLYGMVPYHIGVHDVISYHTNTVPRYMLDLSRRARPALVFLVPENYSSPMLPYYGKSNTYNDNFEKNLHPESSLPSRQLEMTCKVAGGSHRVGSIQNRMRISTLCKEPSSLEVWL